MYYTQYLSPLAGEEREGTGAVEMGYGNPQAGTPSGFSFFSIAPDAFRMSRGLFPAAHPGGIWQRVTGH